MQLTLLCEYVGHLTDFFGWPTGHLGALSSVCSFYGCPRDLPSTVYLGCLCMYFCEQIDFDTDEVSMHHEHGPQKWEQQDLKLNWCLILAQIHWWICTVYLFVQARTQIRCIYNDIGQNYIHSTCSCSSSMCDCIELDVTGSDSGDVLYWHKAASSMSGERLSRSPVKSRDGASIVQWQTWATCEDRADTSMRSNRSLVAFEALSFFSFLFSFYIFYFYLII